MIEYNATHFNNNGKALCGKTKKRLTQYKLLVTCFYCKQKIMDFKPFEKMKKKHIQAAPSIQDQKKIYGEFLEGKHTVKSLAEKHGILPRHVTRIIEQNLNSKLSR